MAKIKKIQRSENSWQYHFVCPGCNCEHAFDDRWKFNHDFDKPTISPSFLQRGFMGFKNEKPFYGTCHSFIENGSIRFLSDCSHELAGRTVELPDIE
ncbi:MAG: anaerobic dehydrogenase [Deltaproteobacteria bacterium HGW-Deltaproteobacteria-23]|nr:MAG: anaerobic dehydrogenase [Deltaproteobacteria bacterium HGW-Deltaproteobacteria-23]